MTLILRMDVDVHNASLVKNLLHRRETPSCHYLLGILKLCSDHDVKLLISLRPNVLPEKSITDLMIEDGHEICLHANGLSSETLMNEKRKLETHIGRQVKGLTYHGGGLLENAVYQVFRRERYCGHPGTPFQALLAGFEYDATGYSLIQSEFPVKMTLGNQTVWLFPNHISLDIDGVYPEDKINSDLLVTSSCKVFCFHSNYLWGYGFRKRTHQMLLKLFKTIKENRVTTETCSEVLAKSSRILK